MKKLFKFPKISCFKTWLSHIFSLISHISHHFQIAYNFLTYFSHLIQTINFSHFPHISHAGYLIYGKAVSTSTSDQKGPPIKCQIFFSHFLLKIRKPSKLGNFKSGKIYLYPARRTKYWEFSAVIPDWTQESCGYKFWFQDSKNAQY